MKMRNPRVRNIPIESEIQLWKSCHFTKPTLLVKLDEGNYYGNMSRFAYQQLIEHGSKMKNTI